MRTLRSADKATGIFLAILGLATLVASMQIAGIEGDRMHPRTLPILLGWMVLAAGLAMAIGARRYRGQEKLIDWPDSGGKRRVLVTLVTMMVYLALLEPLGFPLSTLLFISFLVWYLGRYRLRWAVLCGVATAAVVLFLFIMFLGLTFPLGPLELL